MSGLTSPPYFSLGFKMMVIEQVLNGHLSKNEASRRYGIKGHSTITRWIRKLHPEPSVQLLKKSNKNKEESSAEKRIKELEEALRVEKLRSLAYKTMIEIAEEKFQIPIEKKSDSKQSKK